MSARRPAALPCLVTSLVAVLAACSPAPSTTAGAAEPRGPRSVVLLIGDGMGPQQVGLLLDWADAAGVAPTQWERLANDGTLGLLRTGADGTPLTDSAAGATALACGVEVPNGFIAMDREGRPTRTCLEDAQATGRSTGLVTTTRITHATPACFASHVVDRGQERAIAKQLVENSGVDVLLGGGGALFDLDAARSAFSVVTTRDELLAFRPDAGRRLLGLFAPSHVPYRIDRDAPGEASAPTLAEMTQRALDVLALDPDGFFLMVEGGRIDHGAHLNDAAAVLGEMREFDDALGVVEAFRARHPDTLVIVTADHETGGLACTGGSRPMLAQDLRAMAAAESSIEAQAPPPAQREPVDPELFGVGRKDFYPAYSHWETSRALARSATWNVSFATQGHTSTPVPVLAAGPGAERLAGVHANELVGTLLRGFMQARPGEEGR